MNGHTFSFLSCTFFACALWGVEGFFNGLVRTTPTCNNRSSNFGNIRVDIKYKPVIVLDEDNENFEVFAEVEWTVQNGEGLSIDGFAVHFLESEAKMLDSSLKHSINTTSPCASGTDHFWLKTTENDACDDSRNVSQCSDASDFCLCLPANCSLLPNPLRCKGTPSLLKGEFGDNVYQTVPSTVTKLRYPIEFHTKYEISVLPYYRQYYNARSHAQSITVDDCEGLLENITGSRETAHELCCQQGAKSIAAYNITKSEPRPSFRKYVNETTVNVTISWNPPAAETFDGFWVNLYLTASKNPEPLKFGITGPVRKFIGNNSQEVNSTACVFRPPEYTWEAVAYNLAPGNNYTVYIHSRFTGDNLGGLCDEGRCYATLTFKAEEPKNWCEKEFGLCDSRATCEPRSDPITGRNATCVCGSGWTGQGLNSQIGEGCSNLDVCRMENDCSRFADCTDLPPPSVNVKCACKEGYFGDGRKSGYGCTSTNVTALAISLPVIAVVIIVIVIVTLYILRKRNLARKLLLERYIADTDNGILMAYINPGTEEGEKAIYAPTFGSRWEIERNTIHFGKVLGRGNYGIVHMAWLSKSDEEKINGTTSNGTLRNHDYNPLAPDDNEVDNDGKTHDNATIVAVKHLQESVRNHENVATFLAEISFMLNIGNHENIVRVHGCATTEEPVYLVTEYLRYGDLLHFLWDAREPSKGEAEPVYKVTELSLCTMARDVAKGMAHLQRIRFIHGDVAARNILVGEGGICKVSDFGLANDVYRYNAIQGYKEKFVPFKWISPERMMSGKVPITSYSDVWSYGNLMYEIFTLGCSPHPGVQSSELLDLLRSGYRMQKPNTCNEQMYEIMNKCWRWRQSARPSFVNLVKMLDNEISQLQMKRTQVNLATAVEVLDRELYANEVRMEPPAKENHYVNGNITVVENERDSQSRAM